MGFHISGHMNGVWAHPLKLLDSYQFFLNGNALPAAEKFTSGPGFVKFVFPATSGLKITRTEFAPEGVPVALIGLSSRMRAPNPQAVHSFCNRPARFYQPILGPARSPASLTLIRRITSVLIP